MKFVYDQRKLSSLIDGKPILSHDYESTTFQQLVHVPIYFSHSLELRRMNMRSIVGRKDIFLSYAHINIKFGREIKVSIRAKRISVSNCSHSLTGQTQGSAP